MDVGITVLSDFIQSEGAEAAIGNVAERARATAIALNPTVTQPAPEGVGSFQPPSDGGSSPRTFDRPLWGRRRLWVVSQPSYRPHPNHYADSEYAPRAAGELTDRHGFVVRNAIDLAHARGMEVSFQIGAAAPPGLRDEDRPRLPGGALASHPMASTASLASPAVRSYYRAYLADLLAAYPDVDCLRVDWPEYPCYTLDEAFADFHPAVGAEPTLEREIGAAYRFLRTGLNNATLGAFVESGSPDALGDELIRRFPAVDEWLRLKRQIALDYLRFLREAMDEAGGQGVDLAPNAFPPPFSLLTGLPFGGLHQVSPWVGVKLYTMHWLQIVRFWTDDILAGSPGLDADLLATALLLLFDVGDTLPRPLDAGLVRYPEPDEPHPVGDESQRRSIAQARDGCRARVEPIVHGYGPANDFARRLRAAASTDPQRVWVNRYGYLSDEKLDAVGARDTTGARPAQASDASSSS